jgi:pantoate--beta-alanine ligase
MYPEGPPEVTVDPGPLGERLEGAFRPGHFRGVLTVVVKLFHLTGPCRAYFGEKDFQQLVLVRRMIRALTIQAEVVACPTAREVDGLALSSRNVRLGDEERIAALSLSRGLAIAARLAQGGQRDPSVLAAEMARRIGAEPLARLDYAVVVDEKTFDPPTPTSTAVRALVAGTFGETRLIDNLPLVWDGGRPAR